MADGADLRRFEAAAHPQHDRGRRLGALAGEQRPLRQDEVDAGALHPLDAADGAGKLALQGAQLVHALHEGGRGQRVALVEDLVADAAAARHAALGELQADTGHLVLRHEDLGTVIAQLEAHLAALQLLHDGGGVLEGEVREEQRHLRLAHPEDDVDEEADEAERNRTHRRKPRRSQFLRELQYAVQDATSRPMKLGPALRRTAGQDLPGGWLLDG